MTAPPPPERVTKAFRAFITRLPKGDLELVLLKAHIMIEVEIRLLIDRRLLNAAALKEANALDCHQAIKLAKAFFPPDHAPELWECLVKLNKMRNEIAHNMLPKGSLEDRIEAWLDIYPPTIDLGEALEQRFGLALWSIFCWVAELVEVAETGTDSSKN